MSARDAVEITPESAGWRYAGLRVLLLDDRIEVDTGPDEMLVVPLRGACVVTCQGTDIALAGRDSVFDGPTDFAYLPRAARATVDPLGGCELAFPTARAEAALPFRYGSAKDVRVEERGAGQSLRHVRNLCTPEAFETDRLLAVEVVTPGGNWSSWPPHKHDADVPGGERAKEEIYYYEGGPGYQRVYSSSAGDIDVLREVSGGDYVLVPYGYHGPSMAMPGRDLYYLNVLAGADRGADRSMAFSFDSRYSDPDIGWGYRR